MELKFYKIMGFQPAYCSSDVLLVLMFNFTYR
jgi:hypothetical protein